MRNIIDYSVMCPFYIDEGKTEIRCEGVAEGTTTKVDFAGHQALLRYKIEYCCDKWESCAISKGLGTKYE